MNIQDIIRDEMLKRIVSLFFEDCKKEGIRCERGWSSTPEEGYEKFKTLGCSIFAFTTTEDQKKIEGNQFSDIWISETLGADKINTLTGKYPYLNPPKKPDVIKNVSLSDSIVTINPLRLLG